jgi:tetratricopeptide (TPR) repeat protein
MFRLLQEQLGERLDLPASAITEAVLSERLPRRGATPDLIQRLQNLFQICNQARYAPTPTIAGLMPCSRAGSHTRTLFRICLVLFLSLTRGPAADRPSLFDEANRLYEQGKYAEAASHYESLIASGRNSPGVFFNLGNAWFKQGELGRALLNYRKAEALAPRDPDIQANLRFTRERVSGSLSIGRSLVQRSLNYFTLNELASFIGPLFWVWAALFCAIRLRPRLKPTLKTAQTTVGIALAFSLCFLAAAAAKKERIVIVTSKQATVHLGPLPESQSAFVATDGSELRLLETRPGWLQVSDRSGRTGWLSTKDVAVF